MVVVHHPLAKHIHWVISAKCLPNSCLLLWHVEGTRSFGWLYHHEVIKTLTGTPSSPSFLRDNTTTEGSTMARQALHFGEHDDAKSLHGTIIGPGPRKDTYLLKLLARAHQRCQGWQSPQVAVGSLRVTPLLAGPRRLGDLTGRWFYQLVIPALEDLIREPAGWPSRHATSSINHYQIFINPWSTKGNH